MALAHGPTSNSPTLPAGSPTWTAPAPQTIFAPSAATYAETLQDRAAAHAGLLAAVEWKYEMRRQMQEIVPGLFLGPYTVARDLVHLQRHGISHCVLVRDPHEARTFVRPLFRGAVEYLELDLADGDNAANTVIPLFDQLAAFLRSAAAIRASSGGSAWPYGGAPVPPFATPDRTAPIVSRTADDGGATKGNVLVYCRDGMSRSPTLVIAYVMQLFGCPYEHAYTYVQNRRFCMAPIDSFKIQLLEYEPILRAQGVMAAAPARPAVAQSAAKRRPAEDDDGGEGEAQLAEGVPWGAMGGAAPPTATSPNDAPAPRVTKRRNVTGNI
ncbi:hypothetical protein GGF31_000388 [Allomyces arbusculus]|nr:hypothetical protein GGF31_000388 [Allomyces arbusculus]